MATGRFGTQHSATGESWYISLPGLLVATAGTPAGAYGVLRAAIQHDNAVLLFEHKGLYSREGRVRRGPEGVAEVGKAEVVRQGNDVTVVATLLMVDRALQAAEQLAEQGVQAEVIDLRWLRPLDTATVLASVEKTGRLVVVVVEEQVHAGGWGATIISKLAIAGIQLNSPPQVVGLPDDLLIPYSPELEDTIIPSAGAIIRAVNQMD